MGRLMAGGGRGEAHAVFFGLVPGHFCAHAGGRGSKPWRKDVLRRRHDRSRLRSLDVILPDSIRFCPLWHSPCLWE